MSRLVIGLGFRDAASAQSIAEVLDMAAARAALPSVARAIAVPMTRPLTPACAQPHTPRACRSRRSQPRQCTRPMRA